MSNRTQFTILKKGVPTWNTWRLANEIAEIDLSGANFEGTDLVSVFFQDSNLSRVNFASANLRRANLQRANLSNANLVDVNLVRADLREANLDRAKAGFTIFGDIDLSTVMGLERMRHQYPSTISIGTFRLSKGKIPEAFLRGCGLSDADIEYSKLFNPDLINEEKSKIVYKIYDLSAMQAIQINPLFISYSHEDTAFVDKMDKALTNQGVRFWRDIHDMVAGRMEKQVDLAIRHNPTFLLVLSKNSIQSDWVEHEVSEARKVEKELGRDVLCPVALDDSWKSSKWEERVMEQIMKYNILDFSKWEDKSVFEEKFAKLLSGLDLFYKKPEG